MTRIVLLTLALCAGAAAMQGQEKAPADALTPAQREALQKIVQTAGTAAKVQEEARAPEVGEAAKRIARNLLSAKPDGQLHGKLSAELADAIAGLVRSTVSAKLDAARDLAKVLTPGQKRLVLAELEKPGANPDLIELIAKVFAEKH